MPPRIPPDQVSPYPGGGCASSDVRPLDYRDLILRRRRRTRYGDTPADDSDDFYLTAVQVRQRFAGASDMWLWRRLRDDSKFPRPIEIRKRRYWKLSELVAWERACVRTARLPPPKSARPETEAIGQPASKSRRLGEFETNNLEPIEKQLAKALGRREAGS
jgi:predicted DNA-binding transcriptional regulator AlpA